jgi:hypothetical protein
LEQFQFYASGSTLENCLGPFLTGDNIGISSKGTGSGQGTVNYFVLPNKTGKKRTGTLTIAERRFVIIQQAQ